MTGIQSAETDFDVVRRRRIPSEPLGYVAPLDGLRAVAVLGVLVYHARFSWLPGGYLGVSTFFTLSGFLITSLLLREWNRDGSVSLRGFWTRRFRRLLPASWLTMGLVVTMGLFGAWGTDQLRHLRADLPFALAEIVNWHFVFAGRSYGDVFSAPSPLEHFWSLAVEQQFYIGLPLLVLGVLSIGARRSPRQRVLRLAAVLALLATLSAVLNGLLGASSVDRAYFGTDTRMFELLVGALLACATLRRLRFEGTVRALLIAAGVLGLAGTFWLWHVAPLRSGWMYPWGLLLTAACTAAVVIAAVQPGPLAQALGVAPLRWIGKVSYGVYLLHWPVFLWLSPARVGWSQWPLFGLRVAVTFAAATLMFHFVEDPIRRGVRLGVRRGVAFASIAAVAILGGNLAATRDLPDLDSLSQASAVETPEAPTTTAPPPPLRTLVVGDELAASLVARLVGVEGFEALGSASPGCGLTVGGWVARADNTAERDVDRCGNERDRWIAAAEDADAEVVVVHGSLRDLTDRRLRKEAPWAGPGTPEVDDFLRTDIGGLVDSLSGSGTEVVLLGLPHVKNSAAPPPAVDAPAPSDPVQAQLVLAEREVMRAGVPPIGHRENDPARVDRFNQLLAEVAESRGIRYFDPSEVTESWPEGPLDSAMRPDGVGYSADAGQSVGDWLLPQLRERVPTAEVAGESAVLAADAPLPEPPAPLERRRTPAGSRSDVLVIGDSVAFNFGFGLQRWAEGGAAMNVHNGARLGCPVARGGSYRFKLDLVHLDPECEWASFFPEQLNATRPDVVVLSSGIWEVVDRRLPGDDRFRSIGDPGVDRYLLREFLAAIDVLGSDGATVVVLTQANIRAGLNQGFTDLPESEPARTARLNDLWREAVALRPGVATLVEFQSWLAARPGGEVDPGIRPDGIHFTDAFAPELGAWLGPQLLDIARG